MITGIIAYFIVLRVNGYVVDYETLKAEQAGVLVLKGDPKDATIAVDGREFNPAIVGGDSFLLPGRYEIIISKDGYHFWQHGVEIVKGRAEVFEPVLFFKNPKLTGEREATTQEKTEAPVNQNLVVKNGEMWLKAGQRYKNQVLEKDQLVTRISESVISATLLDENHVIFQTKNKLRVIDMDGSNDIVLVSLDYETSRPIIALDKGEKVGIFSDGELKSLKIFEIR